jgi:hypothetical protein
MAEHENLRKFSLAYIQRLIHSYILVSGLVINDYVMCMEELEYMCSLGLLATSQQYFSPTPNRHQTPTASQPIIFLSQQIGTGHQPPTNVVLYFLCTDLYSIVVKEKAKTLCNMNRTCKSRDKTIHSHGVILKYLKEWNHFQ